MPVSALISPTWSSRLAVLASGALLLAAAWLAVGMLWMVMGGVEVEPAESIPLPQESGAGNASGEFRWDLFGRTASLPPVQLQPAASADSSGLRLKGLMAGPRGFAIIAAEGSGEDFYRAGDELPGGRRIEAVEAQRVLVERNGKIEQLAFDSSQPGGRRAGRQALQNNAGGVDASRLTGLRGFDSGTAAASIASVPAAAESLGLDAGRLADSISITPVSDGGFRLRPGRDAQLFGQLGLQVNDVVVGVNGQRVSSMQDVEQLFGEIMTSGEVAISVRRDGREVTLRPDLEKIMEQMRSP
ncbi:MAG TPA: type II secretion system protein N [Wenzhouxiangella sp.]|nr:type II secretion system protein N [Wenzhouxiangella sp.]